MQRVLESNAAYEKHRRKPQNYDFSFGRCKTEKLSEQMSTEKAITVLKVRTRGICTNYLSSKGIM